MKLLSFDFEILTNCFVACFQDLKTGEKWDFVMHESRNDYIAFRAFMGNRDHRYVGYNVVYFDYPLIHEILLKDHRLWSGDKIARTLYPRAQSIIDGTFKERPKPLIQMLDLFLVYHFNNKARSTSLKWLEICIGWHNVQEMPISHKEEVYGDQIATVIDYCYNDVGATAALYHQSLDKIKFRRSLTNSTGIDMTNFSDNKIGEHIFLLELEKRAGLTKKKLQSTKKFKKEVNVKDVLLPNISFQTEEFKRVLRQFKNLTIRIGEKKDKTEEELFSLNFDGLKYDLGLGGCHAFGKAGVYKNVVTADIISFYPNMAIGQRLYPKHIGPVFCDIEKYLFEERKKYAKGTAENGGFKLALNGGIGQANTEWSNFADSEFFFSITINGQLIICILCERLVLAGAAKIVMVNTDSIDAYVIDQHKFDDICAAWQKEFNLALEFDVYERIMAPNINNYIGLTASGKVKEKGSFETKKDIWKDQSMRIVPLAVRAFFEKGTPIEETIEGCQDIGLFLMGARAKTGNLAYKWFRNGVMEQHELPKNVRYYISLEGGSIVKLTKKKQKEHIDPQQISLFDVQEVEQDKVTNLHVGYKMTLFNLWVDKPFEEYGIDKSFYINEAKKILSSVGL